MMIEAHCNNCRGCPTEKPAVVTRQPHTSEVAIVFDSPAQMAHSKDDWYAGRPGSAGSLIKQCLEGVGIDLSEVYTCSALNCRPNFKKDAMIKKAMLSCRPRLIEELKQANVSKILCLGPVGYSALMSAERVLPITKNRGKWQQAFGMNVLATFAPDFLVAVPDWYRDFEEDLDKFVSTDGPMPFPDVEMIVPETAAEADEAIAYLKRCATVSCDLETDGLSPIKNRILAAGFGVVDKDGSGVSIVFDHKILDRTKTWKGIQSILNSEKIETVFHNGKFDLQFLKAEFARRGLRYAPRNIHDTMLLHYTLDERPMGRYGSHVLERLAWCRYDAPAYGIDMKQFLAQWHQAVEDDDQEKLEELRTSLRPYLSLDVYYTARLFPDLWNEAMNESQNLLDLYEDYLLPGSLAFADIEYQGVLIDRTFYEKAAKTLDRKAKTVLNRLRKATGNDEFNPGSPKQVADFVYHSEDGLQLPFGEKARKRFLSERKTRRKGERARHKKDPEKGVTHTARRGGLREGPTAKAVLKALARDFGEDVEHNGFYARQILLDIVEYRNLTKNAGTYVKGMLERVDVDGRIRGNFNLHGTATGRLSSDNPNLQNIPDASHTGVEVRNGFIAPVGSVLIEADYSQLELRVAAWLSDDQGFKDVFIEGRDVHQEVTWALFEKTKEEASAYERYMAKCCNFGVMYGRGAASLAEGPEMDYIQDNGGTRWSKDEVQEFFDRMLGNWPRYNEWMDEQRALVYEQQFVETPTGRRRRFPFIPPNDSGAAGRQAINTPIQGTASDFTVSALIRIHARLPKGAAIVSTVHDSILIECKKALVDEVLEIVKYEMEENLPFDNVDLPFLADAEIAEKWGDTKSGKFAWVGGNLVEAETA